MKTAVGEPGVLNWVELVEPPAGAVTTDQVPLPVAGLLAARVTDDDPGHSVWSDPALEVVGGEL